MANAVKYVRTRAGVYQYERRVPANIRNDAGRFAELFRSRPLFRLSLKTKDTGKMLAEATRVHEHFEGLIRTGPNSPTLVTTRVISAKRVVADDDLTSLTNRYETVVSEPFERLTRRANVSVEAAEELARLEYEFERDAELIAASLRSKRPDPDGITIEPHGEAEAVIAELGFDAPSGSEQRGAIIAAIRVGMERGYKRIMGLTAGDIAPSLKPSMVRAAAPRRHTLHEAVEAYIFSRKPAVKSESEMRLALRLFEGVIGRKSLGSITRDDVNRYAAYLGECVVGGKTAGSIKRPLSEHTIGKRVRMLGAATNHARHTGVFDGVNPFADIKVSAFARPVDKTVMPDKRRLQVSELNELFKHPWFTGCQSSVATTIPGTHRLDDSRFWAPIVALYTGCRAGELGGLKINEVRLDDPCPHFIIKGNEYSRTKSNKTRRVPILDALLRLGFAEYVDCIAKSGSDRLFLDWTASKRKGAGENDFPAWSNSSVVRSFNRTIIPAALGDRLDEKARREVTFHSLRGSFKAMLCTSENVPSMIVNEVVGHEKGELDKRYIGEVTIEETYPVIRGCDYIGLVLPSMPHSRLLQN